MFIAPRSDTPTKPTRRRRSPQAVANSVANNSNTVSYISPTSRRSRATRTQVEALPARAQRLPIWLRGFLFLQQTSGIVAVVAIASTLSLYAWTVYIPKLWTKEYHKLTTLQSHERNLTVINEASKDNLARQAENPQNGLVPPNLKQPPILLPAAPEPPPVQADISTNQNQLPIVNKPLAY